MSGRISRPTPVAPAEYSTTDETIFRRQIEQNFQEINSQMLDARSRLGGESSLSLRRFQFLLMGAPGG
jgi:hypothetical protein